MPDRTAALGFRLPHVYARLLAERAARHGLSPGTFARLLVVEALADADRARVFDELAGVRVAVDRVAANLETAAVALLCDAGRADPAEARAFVAERFRR